MAVYSAATQSEQIHSNQLYGDGTLTPELESGLAHFKTNQTPRNQKRSRGRPSRRALPESFDLTLSYVLFEIEKSSALFGELIHKLYIYLSFYDVDSVCFVAFGLCLIFVHAVTWLVTLYQKEML